MAEIKIGGSSSSWIRICVLLLLGENPTHGYELLQNLERFDVHCVDTGTLYRILRRTERDGLTQSRWETTTSGPARRIYGLTSEGRLALDVVSSELNDNRELVDLFLARAGCLGARV